MRKGRIPLRIFIIFFVISIIIFGLSYFGRLPFINSLLENLIISVQRVVFPEKSIITSQKIKLLAREQEIAKKLVNQAVLEKEVKALRDQFMTTNPPSSQLVPAKIIGAPGLVPGVSLPEYIVVDKGGRDSVKAGQAVVYKNNLIGKVEQITGRLSRIVLTSSTKFSITAKVVNKDGESPVGVGKGQGGGHIILENVLLSEKIEEGDFVATSGEKDVDGTGIPPDLIVGKVISVEKKPSALFQSASVQSLIDPTQLSIVFIVID